VMSYSASILFSLWAGFRSENVAVFGITAMVACVIMWKHAENIRWAREDTDNSMILGVRDFDAENVPPKSRFGNRCTSFVFRTFCGLKVSDTQTGLRVFPNAIIPLMCEIDGERFEYETNMLLVCKNKKIPLVEQKIRTIYIDDNSSTHFRPIRDSLRVYGVIIRFFCSSILSFLIDNGIFNLMYALLKKQIGADPAVTAATVIARVISSLFNYTMNKNLTFESKASSGKTMLKYYMLCAVQALLSWVLVTVLFEKIQWDTTVLKMLVDTLLFFLSYQIQRLWVFKEET